MILPLTPLFNLDRFEANHGARLRWRIRLEKSDGNIRFRGANKRNTTRHISQRNWLVLRRGECRWRLFVLVVFGSRVFRFDMSMRRTWRVHSSLFLATKRPKARNWRWLTFLLMEVGREGRRRAPFLIVSHTCISVVGDDRVAAGNVVSVQGEQARVSRLNEKRNIRLDSSSFWNPKCFGYAIQL